jgi:tyrosine-protein phosphatase YwqE
MTALIMMFKGKSTSTCFPPIKKLISLNLIQKNLLLIHFVASKYHNIAEARKKSPFNIKTFNFVARMYGKLKPGRSSQIVLNNANS